MILGLSKINENIIRLEINEKNGIKNRYQVQDVLESNARNTQGFDSHSVTNGMSIVKHNNFKIEITHNPFIIKIFDEKEDSYILRINSQKQLFFDPYKTKVCLFACFFIFHTHKHTHTHTHTKKKKKRVRMIQKSYGMKSLGRIQLNIYQGLLLWD